MYITGVFIGDERGILRLFLDIIHMEIRMNRYHTYMYVLYNTYDRYIFFCIICKRAWISFLT